MGWIYQICAIALLLVSCFFWLFWKRLHNLPPGPLGLPIVGYAPFMGKYPYLTLMNLAKTYGGMFTLPLGSKSVIVLNNWDSVKETLVEKADTFSGRPSNILVEAITKNQDIIFGCGSGWKERRRFTLQHLRDFGFGKQSMEDVIMAEVNKMLAQLNLNPIAKGFSLFYLPLMNITWSMVGAKSFDHKSEYILNFIDALKIILKGFEQSGLILFLPILKFVPRIIHKAVKARDILHKFFDDEIDEHIKTYQKEFQRDFIDIYLSEIFKQEELGLKTKSFTRYNLKVVMGDLFTAGIDTGSSTLSWALLYMITWPEIQHKVQDELDEVIGRSRLPTFSDLHFLPYTEAVIQEVHRYASIIPLSVPHTTTTSTTVRNYSIPKDTIVLQNIWAVHHDPKLWGDPEVFRPERFLNEKGQLQKPEYLIPFSIGRRYCPGEPLARMEIFLFLSSLLHKFSFSNPVGIPPPKLNPIISATIGPQPFTVIASPRH